MDSVELSLNKESCEAVELEWLKSLEDIKSQNLFCDAVLTSEDGGEFQVHRTIMSLSSPYFRVLFTTKVGAQNRKIFHIPGITAAMLQMLVQYAYTGCADVTEDNIEKVLPAADQFHMLELIKICSDFLLEALSFENCIGIRDFAKAYFCFELDEEANKFLLENFVDVVQYSEEFLELSPEVLIDLLNSDRINVRNEEVVWEAGLKWIDHDPNERMKYISSILRCVRLGLLQNEYFMEKVKLHRYVDRNEDCTPIVNKTLRFLWDLEIISHKTEVVETPFLATPRIPHSILFTIGGWTSGNPTAMIESYDTKADRWIQIPETDPAGARAYHKLAVIGYEIYVIGGFDGNEYFNSCRCFNAVTKEWRIVAPMHSKRCYVSVACLDNFIYAMGGYDGQHRQNTVERYDYRTNQWTCIAPMNVQRSDACATVLNGFIYVVGGFNGTECLSSAECFSPLTGQWTAIPSMSHRRSGVAIIGHHGRIYALGGFNGISRLVNGEVWEPGTTTWEKIPDMLNPRSNFAIEVMDDMIFVIGGFNGVTPIYHVECYDYRTNEWYEATDMNASRSALAACIIPGLPNVQDYVHPNRNGLMEEKRLKLRQHQRGNARDQNSTIDEAESEGSELD